MASRHGKRKIANSRKYKGIQRASTMQDEEDALDLDNISLTANLLNESSTAVHVKRNPRPQCRRLIVLFGGLCALVICIAGLLAWKVHVDYDAHHPDQHPDHHHHHHHDLGHIQSNPAYGLSTEEVFLQHRPPSLSLDAVKRVSRAVNVQDLKSRELGPLLIPRVAGTQGSKEARRHIVNQLDGLGGWDIELDTFQDSTPHGPKSFTNIVATANPAVKRRLVLACHYDSKYMAPRPDGQQFLGATDSALPCAQLMYLVRTLDAALKQANSTNPPVTLQLIFFDGEEAFVRWTDLDSLYGSRNLAVRMEQTPHPPGATNTNLLHGIDMLVLLDLLGARSPSIANYFQSTSSWYQRMANIEQRLKRASLMTRQRDYFNGQQRFGNGIQDDHIPFVQRGVRILHLIPSPFPSVWHKMTDNAAALDDNTISNLSKIFHVFVAEYLSLPV